MHKMAVSGAINGQAAYFVNPESDAPGLDHLILNKWVP